MRAVPRRRGVRGDHDGQDPSLLHLVPTRPSPCVCPCPARRPPSLSEACATPRTQRLQCEIAAHARSVLALQLHPMQEQLISASEDTYINVWNLEVARHPARMRSSAGFKGVPGRRHDAMHTHRGARGGWRTRSRRIFRSRSRTS